MKFATLGILLVLATCVPGCLQKREQSSPSKSEPTDEASARRAADGEYRAMDVKMRAMISRCVRQAPPLKSATHLSVSATAHVNEVGDIVQVDPARSDNEPLPKQTEDCLRVGLSKYRFEERLNWNRSHRFGVRFY